MLLETYRPKTLKSYGHSDVVTVARNFIEAWMRGAPFEKALLLYGPPGTGKTTLVRCLARSYKLEIVDTNASAEHGKDAFERLHQAALSHTFSGSLRVIFFDEADNLTKRKQSKLVDIIRHTKHPIIIAANHYDKLRKDLKYACLQLETRPPSKKQLSRLAERIARDHSIPSSRKKRAIATAKSYRELVSLLTERDADPLDRPDNMQERIRAALSGGEARIRPSEFWAVTAWIVDNTRGRQAAEYDKWWHRYKQVGKPMQKYLLRAATLSEKQLTSVPPEFPWSVSVKAEEETEEPPPTSRDEVVEEETENDTLDSWF